MGYTGPKPFAWGTSSVGYDVYEGNTQGKQYQPPVSAAYHASQPLGYPPTAPGSGLVPRGSLNESCYSDDSRYNPKGDPFYQEGEVASPYQYDPRDGCFPDTYRH